MVSFKHIIPLIYLESFKLRYYLRYFYPKCNILLFDCFTVRSRKRHAGAHVRQGILAANAPIEILD